MSRIDQSTTRSNLMPRIVLALAACVLVAAEVQTAAAQHNSLFNPNRRAMLNRKERAAEGQPNAGPSADARNGQVRAVSTGGQDPAGAPERPSANKEAVEARAVLKADRPEPKPNSVLLAYSPFAVPTREPEKLKVNDLITVIVRESKSATSNSKMESKKDWQLDSVLSRWITLDTKQGVAPAKQPEGQPATTFTYQNDYKGDGRYDRSDELTTRMTVRVIDVKPNGNLVVEGADRINLEGEEYTLTLVGECRAKDVTPENTILSTQIANRHVNVETHGAVRDATRRGWLQRGLDFLRLF